MADNGRTEGFPSLAARDHWGRYATGLVTEVLFVGGLMAMGLVLALLGTAIWR